MGWKNRTPAQQLGRIPENCTEQQPLGFTKAQRHRYCSGVKKILGSQYVSCSIYVIWYKLAHVGSTGKQPWAHWTPKSASFSLKITNF